MISKKTLHLRIYLYLTAKIRGCITAQDSQWRVDIKIVKGIKSASTLQRYDNLPLNPSLLESNMSTEATLIIAINSFFTLLIGFWIVRRLENVKYELGTSKVLFDKRLTAFKKFRVIHQSLFIKPKSIQNDTSLVYHHIAQTLPKIEAIFETYLTKYGFILPEHIRESVEKCNILALETYLRILYRRDNAEISHGEPLTEEDVAQITLFLAKLEDIDKQFLTLFGNVKL